LQFFEVLKVTNKEKSDSFLVRDTAPYNGEPPLDILVQNQLTPTEMFFVRNHGDIPRIDPALYRLTVNGFVKSPLVFSLDELMRKFPTSTVIATIQCAGNRRQEMARVAPIPGELPWDSGAISTAEWRGFHLRDILTVADLGEEAQHVDFTGLDQVSRQGRSFGFGGSIPLHKALGPEALIAYEMNGQPLTPMHGFPLRVVIPGYIGARSVKWLSNIEVRSSPSQNYFYAHAYQLFPPQANPQTVDWDSGIKLGDYPVNAVICTPKDGERVTGKFVSVRGYACAGGGRTIERVDLSTNGGKTWIIARLDFQPSPWAWRLWQADLEVAPGLNEIMVRAMDSAANSQPEAIHQTWNFKGYLNNSQHRVRIYYDGR
jgi:sulfite oxidase